MTDTATKLSVHRENAAPSRAGAGLAGLRRDIERLFDEFDSNFWTPSLRRSFFDVLPFARNEAIFNMPPVDISEKAGEFEITAEVPGMDEKDIEVKLANGGLMIKGEKKAEKEERRKDCVVSERRYGSFQRYFGLPNGVDTDKVTASFHNGVLTVTLPKSAEARKQEKTITVKAA